MPRPVLSSKNGASACRRRSRRCRRPSPATRVEPADDDRRVLLDHRHLAILPGVGLQLLRLRVVAAWPSIPMWARISEPSASVSTTLPWIRRSAGVSRFDRRVLEALGPDAEDHLAAVVVADRRMRGERLVVDREGVDAHRRRERSPSLWIIASTRFIDGLPMKPADEEVDGAVVELLGRRDLLQLAGAHDRDAVAHRHRLDLVVRDVDRRDVEVALQARDLGARLHAQLGVEVRERLVHQERLRMRARSRGPSRRAGADRPRARAACGSSSGSSPSVRAASFTRWSISAFGTFLTRSPNAMFS